MKLKSVKNLLKKIVFKSSILKVCLSGIYRLLGRRPWSMGYNVYKFEYITRVIENELVIFKDQVLPINYGHALDERVVEYPWLMAHLKNDEKTLLDAGSVLNHYNILKLSQLRNRNIYISTLDFEGFASNGKMASYIYEDIRDMSFNDNRFDAIVCLSTLEHVGMDNSFLYTEDESKNEFDSKAYLDAIPELKRVLKRGGTLYLSLPYGKHNNHRWLQVFDERMIEAIKDKFLPNSCSETYFKYDNKGWKFSNKSECRDGVYFDIHYSNNFRADKLAASECVACLEMTK